MMGPPYYYDVHFDPVDVVFHDCMWSGTCCIHMQVGPSNPPAWPAATTPTASASSTPISSDDDGAKKEVRQFGSSIIGGSGNSLIRSATTSLASTTVTAAAATVPTTAGGDSKVDSRTCVNQIRTAPAATVTTTTTTAPAPRPVVATPSDGRKRPRTHVSASKSTMATAASTTVTADGKRKSRYCGNPTIRQTAVVAPSPAMADNKKLRHREVEKNRHRQLQAMVKTLSERIPGKIDKETQVQTMKRAAKYCLYLRDVLTHGQRISKDKLERLYLRSCENVDLMMAHDEHAKQSPLCFASV